MSKDNGGSAFPVPSFSYVNGEVFHGSDGMTLRDYFAAKAMQGALAGLLSDGSRMVESDAEGFARMVFIYADAMLIERAK